MLYKGLSLALIRRVSNSRIVKYNHKSIIICSSVEQLRMGSSESKSSTIDGKDDVSNKTLYDFSVKNIDGSEESLAKYKGHPVVIVNVASKCGLTDANYKQLNEIYDKYEKNGLKIAAFPSNQFNNQEPGCDVDIKEFARKKGVRYDMFSKIDVNGNEADPLYKWLKKEQGGLLGLDEIKWNFTKFLVNKEGKPIKRYAPTTEPKDIEVDIKSQL